MEVSIYNFSIKNLTDPKTSSEFLVNNIAYFHIFSRTVAFLTTAYFTYKYLISLSFIAFFFKFFLGVPSVFLGFMGCANCFPTVFTMSLAIAQCCHRDDVSTRASKRKKYYKEESQR